MSVMAGDFIGFTYNGVRSSELGILHVSDGSRYSWDLLPTIQDKTIPVPGGDGQYFFGSQYTQKQFSVSYAFDSVTEEKIRQMKELFGDRKIHDLIFDEQPYKVYRAKVTGSTNFKFVCFDEGPEHRLYKGEGTLQFTCFFPYAKSRFKTLEDFQSKSSKYEWDNRSEWVGTSGIKTQKDRASAKIDKLNGNRIAIYNPGELPSHFKLKIGFSGNTIPSLKITLGSNQLVLNSIQKKGNDTHIQIDSKTNLIEGLLSNGQKSGTIYNEAKKAGTFFTIPCSRELQTLEFSANMTNHGADIQYDYYYY